MCEYPHTSCLQGIIKAPLWDLATKPATAYPSNDAFVREYVVNLLATSFPNLTQQQVRGGRGA